MAAYVVMIRERTKDAEALSAYGVMARAARGDHQIRPLAFYGPHQVTEGEAVEGVVLLEFADMAAARAWYDSPAYQAAKAQRETGADYRVIFVEGVG